MELKIKKKIAREILLFFGTILISGLFYMSVIFCNVFLNGSITKLSMTIKTLQIEIDKLPQDRIKKLYQNGMSAEMVVNYQVDNNKYVIPKKEEKEFISDYPNAIKRAKYPDKYTYVKVKSMVLLGQKISFSSENELSTKVKKLFPSYSDISNNKLSDKLLKQYFVQDDSIPVFDYVDIDEFRILMKDSIYRNEFYDFTSQVYDIGTRQIYNQKINESLQYTDSVKIKSKELYKDLTKKINRLRINEYRLEAITNIHRLTLIFSLIILGLLYPIRLVLLALLWSIRTIKE